MDEDAIRPTFADLVAAVMEAAGDERLVAPVIQSMLRRGAVRLRGPARVLSTPDWRPA
jgi:hypothetical protein